MVDEIFDYPAYLAAKKSIDDLSLNKQVWSTMCYWLEKRQKEKGRVKILEIGAGIGTMIERFLELEVLKDCIYTAIEQEPYFKDHALARLSKNKHYNFHNSSISWQLSSQEGEIYIKWINGDAMEIDQMLEDKDFDLVISHAVIDLLPVPVFLPRLFEHLCPDGAYYFSLNFSGKTLFTPTLDNDECIYEAYHLDMDSRFTDINWCPSMTGVMLGDWLINEGHEVLATGPSDWKLSGKTDQTNVLFIENILQTIEKALGDLPELESWLRERKKQLSSGELGFMASNMDYFGLI